MNLRNKKTGESGELHYYPDKAYHFAVSTKDPTQTGIYKTLGELLQDWTDFIVHEPTEPLIDDKDIRNRLRKWMEAIGISLDNHLTRVQSGDCGLIIESGDNRIAFRYYKKLLYRRKTRKTDLLTIRELIGEEIE